MVSLCSHSRLALDLRFFLLWPWNSGITAMPNSGDFLKIWIIYCPVLFVSLFLWRCWLCLFWDWTADTSPFSSFTLFSELSALPISGCYCSDSPQPFPVVALLNFRISLQYWKWLNKPWTSVEEEEKGKSSRTCTKYIGKSIQTPQWESW